MKKKYLLIALAVLTVVGSLFTVLGSNMLFDDLFNKGVPFSGSTLFASLPAVSVALVFVVAVLYAIRMYRHRDCQKRLSRLYLIYVVVFGCIGFVGAILAGTTIYHTFTGNHPFAGYLIIFMILDLLLIGGGVFGLLMVRKMKEDEGRIKVNFKYVMSSMGWFLFIGLVFNKFGLFLGSPVFIYWRNFYQTFPVYLYLLVPLAIGVMEVCYKLDVLKREKLFLASLILLGLNVCGFGYTVLMGLSSTAFVSSISQLMPISRMAAMPIEVLIHFLAYAGAGVALLLQNRKPREKAD